MSYRTIRDLTAETGVTESALRYYDEKGILEPTVKSRTGRREWLYDDEAVRRLEQIILFKRIGLSTEYIGMMFEGNVPEREALIGNHLERLRESRDRLDRQIAAGELVKMIEEFAADDEELRTALIERAGELFSE